MKKIGIFVISTVLFLFIISSIIPGYLLPTDILQNVPSYSQNNWSPPKNSLIADPIFQFEPWRYVTKQQILQGNLPLWNDKNAFGAPFFANPQTAVLYPLNVIYYFIPTHTASFFIPFLKLFFLGLFSYLYFRSIKVSLFGSLFGAISVTFSAFPIVWLLWPHTNVFILFPLLLFLTEKLRSTNNNSIFITFFIALSYTAAVFGGHPETLFQVSIIHVIYTITRLWNDRKKLLYFCGALISALLMTSAQLLPFLEYLFNSYAVNQRQNMVTTSVLPLKGLILQFIPFFLGAPHQAFYKPISEYTNYQESIGGYIGVIPFLMALYGIVLLYKNKLVRFWIIIAVICFGIAYAIPPFTLVHKLPIFHEANNQRLIGFYGFSLIVIATIAFDYLNIQKLPSKILQVLAIMVFLSLVVMLFILPHLTIQTAKPEFLQFLINHVIYMYITTTIGIWTLLHFKNTYLYKCILLVVLLSQTLFLFWNYNTRTSAEDYYPKNPLIRELQSLPNGTYLEVGNPNLPQNINLMYNLSSAENYDALEINSYSQLFNKTFPYKNNWKKVDSFTVKDLQKMYISYVISDFNVNLQRTFVQTSSTKVFDPLIKGKSYSVSFTASNKTLKGLRIITANYNRNNSCSLLVQIFQRNTTKKITSNHVSCNNVRDHEYLFIPLNATLIPKTEYIIIISSPNGTDKNSVTLIGSSVNLFYLEVFYPSNNKYNLQLLWHNGSIFLWKTPNVSNVDFKGNYKILQNKPTNISVLTSSNQPYFLTISSVRYPGWYVSIDGKKAQLFTNTFLTTIVPKGDHIVTFSYFPYSFYLGLFLSIVTFFIVAIVFLKKHKFSKNYTIKKYSLQNNESFLTKTLVYSAGVIIGISIFLFFLKFILPRSLTLPPTTAINYLTIHKHSLTLDYIIFGLFVSIITITICICWFLYIWVKER